MLLFSIKPAFDPLPPTEDPKPVFCCEVPKRHIVYQALGSCGFAKPTSENV